MHSYKKCILLSWTFQTRRHSTHSVRNSISKFSLKLLHDIKAKFRSFPLANQLLQWDRKSPIRTHVPWNYFEQFSLLYLTPQRKYKIRVVNGEENENVPSSLPHLSLSSTLICMMLKFFRFETRHTRHNKRAAFRYHLSPSAQREAFQLNIS